MYSPFFTSGFLVSSPLSPSSSFDSPTPRRSSLPTATLASPLTSSPTSPAEVDDASAFYFTLQPARSEREFRSFLSLDLADSHSLRTVSQARSPLRSNPSSLRDSSTYTNIFTFTWPPSALKRTSVRRPSRDSLRNIPSPKPAPSTTLPSLPGPSKRAPSASSISSSVQPTPSIRPTPSFRAGRHADALARLEGRAKDDFLIFNDEDEETDVEMELEPEDVVIPLSPISNTKSIARRISKTCSKSMSISYSHPYTQKSRPRRKSTKSGSVDMYQFASFIDLGVYQPRQNIGPEESISERWNWRSFIDVGGI